MNDNLLGFLVGFPLGASVAWVWYEISGLWPRWVMRCDASESYDGGLTHLYCERCHHHNEFKALTVSGGLAYRMQFVRRHAFCAPSIDDRGTAR